MLYFLASFLLGSSLHLAGVAAQLITRIDDRDPAFTYTGSWTQTTVTNSNVYDGTLSGTSDVGAVASLTFTGLSFLFLSKTTP